MQLTMSEIKGFLLPNEPTCIVASSGSAAHVWRTTSRFGEWQLLSTLENPEASRREADFASDRPGRSFDSFGRGRHAMEPGHSGHEHELSRFAQQVADKINAAFAAGSVAKLVLLAEPKFLGLLRTRLSHAAAAGIVLEASKNLVKLDVNEIRSYFQ